MHNRNFLKLLSGTIVSSLGSFSFNYGFISYIYFFTDQDKRFVGAVQLLFVVGLLSGNLFSNKISNQFNKRKAIIIIELLRIPFMLSMIIFAQHIWILLALHGIKTFFAGVSTPIRRAFIVDLLPREQVNRGNTIFTTLYALIQVLGPLIGTWAYSLFHNITYLVLGNVIAFILAALCYLFITHSAQQATLPEISIHEDIIEGINYIKKRTDLKGIFFINALSGLVAGVSVPLILPFVVEVLHLDARAFGFMMLSFGVGGIVGGTLNALNKIPLPLGQIISKSSIIEALLMLIWASALSPILSFIAIFLWGAIFFIRTPSFFNYFSSAVDKSFLIRSHSLIDFNFTLFNALAALAVAIAGKHINTQPLLIFVALGYLIILLFTYSSPLLQTLRKEQYE